MNKLKLFKINIISCAVLVTCSTLLVGGCVDAYNEYECYKSVQREFPNSDIEQIPDHWEFIVRDSTGAIWLAKTNNATNAEVSKTVKLLDGNDGGKSN